MPPSNTPLAALRAISRYSAKSTTKSYAPLRLASRPRQQQPSIHHIIPSTLSTRFYSSSSQDSSSPPPSPPQTSSTFPRPLTDRTSTPSPNFSHTPRQRPPKPEYQITFTCDPCSTRSTHKISKQGYHKGSVLISCPECKNRHVISDHLGIFSDKSITIEDLMKERGQIVKRGTLSEEGGDIEFWADEGVTKASSEETK